mgnify:FL=1
MEAILDTNFIITCVKQKIQVFDVIKDMQEISEIAIPLEVTNELEKIQKNPKFNKSEREAAELSLFMIKKKNLTITILGTKEVDSGLLRYCIQNPCIIATLDRNLKEKIRKKSPKTKFLTIRNKRKIEIQ